MARVRATGLNASTLSFLGSLGVVSSDDDDRAQGYQVSTNLGGLGNTMPSITGIDAVDRVINKVTKSLDDLETALTISTIASTTAALCGILLLFRVRK